jgi:hypothetical protein
MLEMKDVNITEAEELFCHYKLGMAGHGFTALINAIFALDTNNRRLIAKGFPELVEVVNKYQLENSYWPDLAKRYKEKNPYSEILNLL